MNAAITLNPCVCGTPATIVDNVIGCQKCAKWTSKYSDPVIAAKSWNDLLCNWSRLNKPTKEKVEAPALDAKSILLEAEHIINGPRREAYGPAEQSFARIAQVWSLQIEKKLKEPLTSHEVAMLMVGFKLVRESNSHGRDNLVDICGYAELGNQCFDGAILTPKK